MADNIAVTPGTGATVAADDIVGVLYQRVKVTWGVDGVATDATATTPLPIDLVSWGGTATAPLNSDPVPISSADLGTTASSAITNPATSAPLISIAKGWLTGLGEKADAAWTTGSGSTIAILKAIAAGTQVFSPGDLIDVLLTVDTLAYSAGDVLADTQAINNAVRVNGGRALLQSVTIIDEEDQGAAFTLIFLSANNSLGIENAAPSITDLSSRDILGWVDIGTSDYKDLGGTRVASVKGIGLLLEAASASTTLYIAVINGSGTPTYPSPGLRVKLGLIWA